MLFFSQVFQRQNFGVGALILAIFFGACSKKESTTPTSSLSETDAKSALVARGRAIYMANCLACHSANPSKVGSVGPAVANASLELVQARVVSGKYPEGYQPQRKTHMMPAQPHLASEVAALHAFLNSKF